MGNYRNAVITEKGLEYIAQALAGDITLTFSHMAISDYVYPGGTNLSALTALQSVRMTVEPASVWVNGNTVGVRGMFSNAAVASEYNIETVGVYATNGTTEVLFSVSTATSPDVMEPYNGVAPSSFIFTVQETINEATELNISITTTGTATAADILQLQQTKQDTITGAASTIANSNLTASRALVSNGSGKVTASSTTAAELGYVHGVTSPIQTQLDGKQGTINGGASTIATSNLTASRALVSNATGKVAASATTAEELGYVHGVTSPIQTQLDALKRQVVTEAGTNLNNYVTTGVYYFNSSVTPANVPDGTNGVLLVYSLQASDTATTNCKQLWLRQGTPGTNSYQAWERSLGSSGWSSWVRYLTEKDVQGAVSTILSATLAASRALVSDASGNVSVSSVTATELFRLSGVTGNVQTQLDGKQGTINGGASTITDSNLTASRALVSNASGKVVASDVTAVELGRLSGVTGNVQTQLNGKQATISGAASTIASSDLTPSRAVIADDNGKISVSSVTATELYRLSGITSNVQTQIDGKAPTSHASSATTYGIATASNYGHVKIANNLTTGSFDSAAPAALSAYQGKVLKDLYDNLWSNIWDGTVTYGGSFNSPENVVVVYKVGRFVMVNFILYATSAVADGIARQLLLGLPACAHSVHITLACPGGVAVAAQYSDANPTICSLTRNNPSAISVGHALTGQYFYIATA